MPLLQGIEAAILVHPAAEPLPEYSHPETLAIPVPAVEPDASDHARPASATEYFSTAHAPPTCPSVSVYVPSIPGTQFSIHYNVVDPPDDCCHWFFKLFMNGRHITSWGINADVIASGTVTRALYEPGSRWHYKECGIVLKRQGIESHSFCFASEASEATVAEDGGLIEVRVFRARGRRRIAPMLTQHRGQERYGIAAPSQGLLDYPEEATYHDWALIDPKHTPYVVFRFHYRSWENLRQLNLVSTESPCPWTSARSTHTPMWSSIPMALAADNQGLQLPESDFSPTEYSLAGSRNSSRELTASPRSRSAGVNETVLPSIAEETDSEYSDEQHFGEGTISTPEEPRPLPEIPTSAVSAHTSTTM